MIRSEITSSGGVLINRLLWSRWIARVCRTVLLLGAVFAFVLVSELFVMSKFYHKLEFDMFTNIFWRIVEKFKVTRLIRSKFLRF
jgi:hypothetical protein